MMNNVGRRSFACAVTRQHSTYVSSRSQLLDHSGREVMRAIKIIRHQYMTEVKTLPW